MNHLKPYPSTTIAFAILSLFALLLSHLALTDIAHGEPDVSGEWLTLRLAALVILAFIVSTLVTLRQVLKSA